MKAKKKITKKKSIKKKRNISKPKIGDKVTIIIKPYKKNITETGIVRRILTKKEFHTRGHKVMLSTGTIGRTIRLLRKNS